ncbi:MAG: DNA primase small subunit [Candidatus Njordarchaeales archaeon]
MPTKLTPEILSEYYRRKFSVAPLLKVVSVENFDHREFGFLVISEEEQERFIRNLSFKTPFELKKFMSERGVLAAYVGALFDPPPTPETSITQLRWLGRELVFDIDLTDYDDLRTCGKGKDHVCPVCWKFVVDAALIIDETLREDFGFSKIVWVYSGRRGVHAWVLDKEAKELSEEAREAVAVYVSPDSPDEPLAYRYQMRLLKMYAMRNNILLTNLRKRDIQKLWKEVRKSIPRIDKKVTMDHVRLLRVPGSVHNATGRIVTIIKDIQEFYIDDAPTVWDVLGIDLAETK